MNVTNRGTSFLNGEENAQKTYIVSGAHFSTENLILSDFQFEFFFPNGPKYETDEDFTRVKIVDHGSDVVSSCLVYYYYFLCFF